MEELNPTVQRLEIQSEPASISTVEKMIDNVCEQKKLNEDYYGNILIAITEAVNNAIIHGNKQNPEKKIIVQCSNSDKDINFTIEDQGDGFDFENLPDPTDPDNLEKPHGRGVFLMRNLADEVNFHENGRVVELNFTIISN